MIPFFNLTFSRRDSLELSVEEFRSLLLDPKGFESKKRLKSAVPNEVSVEDTGPGATPAQLPLNLVRPPQE